MPDSPNENLPDLQGAHDAFDQAITELTALSGTLREKIDLADSMDQNLNRRFEAHLEEWRTHIATTFAELERARADEAENFTDHMQSTIRACIKDLAQKQDEVFETFKAENLSLWQEQISAALHANRKKIEEHFADLNLDLQNRTRRLDEDFALALKHHQETTQELTNHGQQSMIKKLEPIMSEIESAAKQRAQESIATIDPILAQIAGHEDRIGALVLQHENDLSKLTAKADALFVNFRQETGKQIALQQQEFHKVMESALQNQQQILARFQEDIAGRLESVAQNYEAVQKKLITDAKVFTSDLRLQVNENLGKTATDFYNKIHSQIVTETERRWHDFDVLIKRIKQQVEQLEKSSQEVGVRLTEQSAISRNNSAKLLGLIKAAAKDYQTAKQRIEAIETETSHLKRRIRWAVLPSNLALLLILLALVYVLVFYH